MFVVEVCHFQIIVHNECERDVGNERKKTDYNIDLKTYLKDSTETAVELAQYNKDLTIYTQTLAIQKEQAEVVRAWIKTNADSIKNWGLNFDFFSRFLHRRHTDYNKNFETKKSEAYGDLDYIKQQAKLNNVTTLLEPLD